MMESGLGKNDEWEKMNGNSEWEKYVGKSGRLWYLLSVEHEIVFRATGVSYFWTATPGCLHCTRIMVHRSPAVDWGVALPRSAFARACMKMIREIWDRKASSTTRFPEKVGMGASA